MVLPDVVSTHPSVQTPSWNVNALQGVSTVSIKLQVPLKFSAKHLLAQSTGFPSTARQFVEVESFQSDLHQSSPSTELFCPWFFKCFDFIPNVKSIPSNLLISFLLRLSRNCFQHWSAWTCTWQTWIELLKARRCLKMWKPECCFLAKYNNFCERHFPRCIRELTWKLISGL